jgi:D-arabinose 1-dehydrogenase-like Zn-dependent alcohol dehydrogenase
MTCDHRWWATTFDRDCHWVETGEICGRCAATRAVRVERAPRGDAAKVAWLAAECDRCRELLEGAEPVRTIFDQAGARGG